MRWQKSDIKDYCSSCRAESISNQKRQRNGYSVQNRKSSTDVLSGGIRCFCLMNDSEIASNLETKLAKKTQKKILQKKNKLFLKKREKKSQLLIISFGMSIKDCWTWFPSNIELFVLMTLADGQWCNQQTNFIIHPKQLLIQFLFAYIHRFIPPSSVDRHWLLVTFFSCLLLFCCLFFSFFILPICSQEYTPIKNRKNKFIFVPNLKSN